MSLGLDENLAFKIHRLLGTKRPRLLFILAHLHSLFTTDFILEVKPMNNIN